MFRPARPSPAFAILNTACFSVTFSRLKKQLAGSNISLGDDVTATAKQGNRMRHNTTRTLQLESAHCSVNGERSLRVKYAILRSGSLRVLNELFHTQAADFSCTPFYVSQLSIHQSNSGVVVNNLVGRTRSAKPMPVHLHLFVFFSNLTSPGGGICFDSPEYEYVPCCRPSVPQFYRCIHFQWLALT